MSANKKNTLILIIFLISILALWGVNILIPIVGETHENSYKMRFLVIWYGIIIIFSTIFIIKSRKMITSKDIIIGIVLGLLGGQSNSGNDIYVSLVTCLAYIASMLIFYKCDTKVCLIKLPLRKQRLFFIAFILIIIGLALNYNQQIFWNSFMRALQPGVSEEIIFRMFLFALSMLLIGGKMEGDINTFLCYVIMIFPHALFHYQDRIIGASFIIILCGVLIKSIIYFLPLTALLLKKGLLISIGVHFLIDFISFCQSSI